MADHPLRPATDRRLGEPLPHQLANRTRAPPEATCAFGPQATSGISRSFPRLFRTSGQVPTRYSPVRHSRVATSVRLACVRHAASVRSEPGSNSQVNGRTGEPARQSTRARTCHSVTRASFAPAEADVDEALSRREARRLGGYGSDPCRCLRIPSHRFTFQTTLPGARPREERPSARARVLRSPLPQVKQVPNAC